MKERKENKERGESESEENKGSEEENVRLTLLDQFESCPESQPLCPAAAL